MEWLYRDNQLQVKKGREQEQQRVILIRTLRIWVRGGAPVESEFIPTVFRSFVAKILSQLLLLFLFMV